MNRTINRVLTNLIVLAMAILAALSVRGAILSR